MCYLYDEKREKQIYRYKIQPSKVFSASEECVSEEGQCPTANLFWKP